MSNSHALPADLHATKHIGGLLILAAIGLTAVALTQGRLVAEKVVTGLLLPAGLTWLGLSLLCYFSLLSRHRLLFLLSLLTWLLFSLSSNNLIATRLLNTLEEEYVHSQPLRLEQPYDLLVVLGGGSSVAANGQLQFGQSGDRIALAARMYHAGHTKRILCTGSKIAAFSTPEQLGAGEQSQALLQSLAVPAAAIDHLPGRNTSEEITHLAGFLADHQHARIGLLTSAWHLPRAMRLAQAADLQVEAVPADFKTGRQPLSIRSFIPSDTALTKTHIAAREYLARLVNR